MKSPKGMADVARLHHQSDGYPAATDMPHRVHLDDVPFTYHLGASRETRLSITEGQMRIDVWILREDARRFADVLGRWAES